MHREGYRSRTIFLRNHVYNTTGRAFFAEISKAPSSAFPETIDALGTRIINNIFNGNRAESSQVAIQIRDFNSDSNYQPLIFTDNTVSDNVVDSDAAAVVYLQLRGTVAQSSHHQILRNRFVGNNFTEGNNVLAWRAAVRVDVADRAECDFQAHYNEFDNPGAQYEVAVSHGSNSVPSYNPVVDLKRNFWGMSNTTDIRTRIYDALADMRQPLADVSEIMAVPFYVQCQIAGVVSSSIEPVVLPPFNRSATGESDCQAACIFRPSD